VPIESSGSNIEVCNGGDCITALEAAASVMVQWLPVWQCNSFRNSMVVALATLWWWL